MYRAVSWNSASPSRAVKLVTNAATCDSIDVAHATHAAAGVDDASVAAAVMAMRHWRYWRVHPCPDAHVAFPPVALLATLQ